MRFKGLFRMTYTVVILISILSSCSMKLDGNYIVLEPSMTGENTIDHKGTRDKYNIPIVRLSNLYLYENDGDEYVTLIFNNNYKETFKVSKKELGKEEITYNLDQKHYLAINKINNEYYVYFHYNSLFKDYRETVLEYTEWDKVKSIETLLDIPDKDSLPSFEEIKDYNLNGKIKTNDIKCITHNIYHEKQLFGEDSLIWVRQHRYSYDQNGRVIDERHSNIRDNQIQSTYMMSYTYDNGGNVIECNKISTYSSFKERVRSLYENGNLIKRIWESSYNNRPFKSEYESQYLYTESNTLSEIRYFYRGKLDYVVKYRTTTSGDRIMTKYNDDGKEIYTNYLDSKNSLKSGYLEFDERYGLDIPYKGYNPSTYSIIRRMKFELSYGFNTVRTSIQSSPLVNEKNTTEITNEEYVFDENCNPIYRYTKEVMKDSQNNIKENSETLLFSYVYDENGNWTMRGGTFIKRSGDLKKDYNSIIEKREITYYD